MKRLISSIAIAIFAIALAPLQALAADTVTTGAWTWTDISDYASTRTNRPIWAMAHTNSGWFYTDGQNLWNGGQVYRFDGNTNVTVTTEVRNAGLDRVDDIVTDGADTTVFLQDVVRLDDQFRIVVNKNGTYYNATDIVRGMLYSNEGISSISGKNGTWYLITTQSRMFRWYANTTSPVQITLPSGITSHPLPSASTMLYSIGQTALKGMKIVPIGSSDWMLMAKADGNWFTYKYNGTTFTNITSTVFPSAGGSDFLVSNGTTAVFAQGSYQYQNANIAQYNGSNIYQSAINHGMVSASITATAFDGTSWILISGNKEVIRMLPYASTVESLGVTRDYFITASGDNSGHILVGGTISQLGVIGPTYPLTAKLVMITENGATNIVPTTTTTTSATDSASGITRSEWLDPNTTSLANGAQTIYHVSASDANGIARTEIVINGATKRTCELGNSTSNTDCNLTIYASEYPAGTNIFVNAKVTDALGNTAWTTGLNITRPNTTVNTTTNSTGSIWTWLSPEATSIYADQSITYYANAQDADGINNIILSVNGTDVRTCSLSGSTATVECTTTIYGGNYSAYSTITLRARYVDTNGNTIYSDSDSLYRSYSTQGTTNTTTNSTGSIWTWLDPEATSIYSDESVTYYANAWDGDGINSIILSINGTDVRTCSLSGSTATVECTTTIYGGHHSAYSTITLRARYVDTNGNTIYSDSDSLYRYYGSSSNSTNSNTTITTTVSLEPNDTTIETDETSEFHVNAQSASGIKSIAIDVNGSYLKTCTYTDSTLSHECIFTLNGSSYTAGSDIFMNALVTDYNGNQIWTDSKTVSVIANTSGSGSNTTDTSGWVSATSNRESGFTSGQSITITLTSGDSNGVARTEIYINGIRSKICTGSTTCSMTVTAPTTGNYFNYAGTMVDTNGNVTTTGYKKIVRK
jgi:hypothetical protein